MAQSCSVIMIGATGAVGGHCARRLASAKNVDRLTLLGRRLLAEINGRATQHVVDLFDSESYQNILTGNSTAICTVGVGRPSKVSKEEFVRTDKTLVLRFAKACRAAGIRHFQLLSAVAANANSPSLYLRTKGELFEELAAMKFERLSIFCPSMLLTPTNRYGLSQAILLKTWPILQPLLIGPLQNYNGISVKQLGTAIANNVFTTGPAVELLHWKDFIALANAAKSDES